MFVFQSICDRFRRAQSCERQIGVVFLPRIYPPICFGLHTSCMATNLIEMLPQAGHITLLPSLVNMGRSRRIRSRFALANQAGCNVFWHCRRPAAVRCPLPRLKNAPRWAWMTRMNPSIMTLSSHFIVREEVASKPCGRGCYLSHISA
jgi:hypothetical protein